jgi:hypothetical protein
LPGSGVHFWLLVGPALAAVFIGHNCHLAIGTMASVCYLICLVLALLSLHMRRVLVDAPGRSPRSRA